MMRMFLTEAGGYKTAGGVYVHVDGLFGGLYEGGGGGETRSFRTNVLR